MAWTLLRTDYTDASWTGLKRYIESDNEDGTISLQDVTVYTNKENSFFGALDANRMNEALNTIMSMVEGGTDLYTAFQNYFDEQKTLFEATADTTQDEFTQYVNGLKTQGDGIILSLQTDYRTEMDTFEDTQQQLFTQWFDLVKGQLSTDVAGNLQNEINENSYAIQQLTTYQTALYDGYYEGVNLSDLDMSFVNAGVLYNEWYKFFEIEFNLSGFQIQYVDNEGAENTVNATVKNCRYLLKDKFKTGDGTNPLSCILDLIVTVTINNSSLTFILPVYFTLSRGNDVNPVYSIKFSSSSNGGNTLWTAVSAVSPSFPITNYYVSFVDISFTQTTDGENITVYRPKQVQNNTIMMFTISDIDGLSGSDLPITIPVKTNDGSDFDITGYTAVLTVFNPPNISVDLLTKTCTQKDNHTFETVILAAETLTIVGQNRYKVTISNSTTTQIPIYGNITIE